MLLVLFGPPAASDSSRTVLVLGDSLSAAHNIPAETGWVALLEQRLHQADPAWTVVNASISGETTDGGLARLPALLARHQPSIVMVELGANDALRGRGTDAIEANLDQIISLSRDAGANVALLGIEIPINYGPRYRRAFTEVYRSLAQTYALPMLPFLLEGVALRPDLMQADGLHPTAEAQARLLENVWPVFVQAAGESFTSPRRGKKYAREAG